MSIVMLIIKMDSNKTEIQYKIQVYQPNLRGCPAKLQNQLF